MVLKIVVNTEGHFLGVVVWMPHKGAIMRLCADPLLRFMASNFETDELVHEIREQNGPHFYCFRYDLCVFFGLTTVCTSCLVRHLPADVGSLLR